MSVLARPEPAPCTVRINCESLESVHKILSQRHYEDGGVATISVRDPISFLDGRQEKYFSAIMGELDQQKVGLSDALLETRKRALESKGRSTLTLLSRKREENSSEEGAKVALRHLHISTCKLDEQGVQKLTEYIQGNALLSTVSLKVNGIIPTQANLMTGLAKSINFSNLRILEMTNNPIGTRSIVQLIEHLDCPSLTQLTLSMTMQREKLADDQKNNSLWEEDKQTWCESDPKDVWRSEVIKVAQSFASLISNDGNDNGGYLPRLERLALNGNDLNWTSVRIIVESILQGNRNLIQVELFGTANENETDDDEKEEAKQRPVTRTRSNSIGCLYSKARIDRTNRPVRLEDAQVRSNNRFSGDMFGNTDEPLSRRNWRFQLGRHLWKNRLNRIAVKDVSRYMLPVVRTLACKCHERQDFGNLKKEKYFPFVKLPPEIRLRIVHLLDERGLLSNRQLERIISYASNPATLGLGNKSMNLGLSLLASQQIYDEGEDRITKEKVQGDYGLIPHQTWNWTKELQGSSPCRDWPATIYDESMKKSLASDDADERDDIQGLGGGGPDGRGGLTNGRKVGPDSSRRKWLEEQSGLHAFWETTGTYREE